VDFYGDRGKKRCQYSSPSIKERKKKKGGRQGKAQTRGLGQQIGKDGGNRDIEGSGEPGKNNSIGFWEEGGSKNLL